MVYRVRSWHIGKEVLSGSPLDLAQAAAGNVEPCPEVESRHKNSSFREESGVEMPIFPL